MALRTERMAWVLAVCMLAGVAFSPAFAAWETENQSTWLSKRWDASYKKVSEQLSDGQRAAAGSDQARIWRTDGGEVDVILRRTEALLKAIEDIPGAPSMSSLKSELSSLKQQAEGNAGSRTLFIKVCEVRREIAMKNPLLDFDSLMFAGYESVKPQFHSQQMAWYAKDDPGAGLYLVRGYKGTSPQVKDLLESATVTNGEFAGERLSNKNSKWQGHASFFTPDLSFDAKSVMFAWAPWACNKNWSGPVGKYSKEGTHRIFGMDLDGSNLRQLVDHPQGEFGKYYDTYDPCFLPSGRILFVSDRHNGGQRCGPSAVSGSFYTIKGDGTDLYRISWHETNVRRPVVANDGRIVFSRWDYIDRQAYSAQSFWIMNPDGTDPRAPHGNYIEDDKPFHPISETDIRPVPNTSGKFMGIEGGHHTAYRGNLVVIDIDKRAKHEQQIRFFWPHWHMGGDNPGINESARFTKSRRNFKMPWPLSEEFVIAVEYSEILLLDAFGNEVLLFDCEPLFDIHAGYPIPVKKRPKPAPVEVRTHRGERREQARSAGQLPKATISVMDVYESDFDWPTPRPKITHLRICQILGRPKNPWNTHRNVYLGWSDGALIKHVIGTVPVEEDGSAYFEAPVEREIFFQAVDSTGMAVQSMLSSTWVQPGEHLSCLGCHEDKWTASPPSHEPAALQRAPSQITPDVVGSYPLTYHRLVKQPVFDQKCAPCHQEKNVGISFDYWNKGVSSCTDNSGDRGPGWDAGDLQDYVVYYGAAYGMNPDIYCYKDNNHEGMLQLGFPGFQDPLTGKHRSRSIPMQIGARRCELLDVVRQHESRGKVDLSYEEFHRITLWMDLNCQEMGTYELTDEARRRQEAGEAVWPSWKESGMDPNNPTGVQKDGDFWAGQEGVVDSFQDIGVRSGPHGDGIVNPAIAFRQNQIVLRGLPSRPVTVVLCDVSGRVLRQRALPEVRNRGIVSCTVEGLTPGTYLTRIEAAGKQWVSKSIVVSGQR